MPDQHVTCVASTSDGRLLAVGTLQGIWLWELETGKEVRQMAGHTGVVVWLAFSPDGRTIASSSYDHTLRLWETRTGRQRLRIAGPIIIGTSLPVRRTTMQRLTPGASAIAWSAVRLSGTVDPRRQASSCVTSTSQPISFMRSESESAEKPPNTTVCGAPRRVHASIAAGSSGTIPM